MLHLITGLPGNGKTLFALSRVHELFPATITPAVGEVVREVYYDGIPDLRLPWFKLGDAECWFDSPAGSVIVIDEAQRIFPIRSSTQPVPQKCREFETHRHKGFDIFLITQDAKLLDVHVRRLVGIHFHLERKFGVQASRLLQFEGCKEPDDYHARQAAVGSVFTFPQKNFSLYRSTTLNTHKSYWPKKLLWLPVMLALLVLCVWGVVRALGGIAGTVGPGGDAPLPAVQKVKAIGAASAGSGKVVLSSRDYVQRYIPRFFDLPWSAPIYDGMAVPSVMPVVSGCVRSEERGCRCYSQQGSLLVGISETFCREYVERGGFQQFAEKVIHGERAARVDRSVVDVLEREAAIRRPVEKAVAPSPDLPDRKPMELSPGFHSGDAGGLPPDRGPPRQKYPPGGSPGAR